MDTRVKDLQGQNLENNFQKLNENTDEYTDQPGESKKERHAYFIEPEEEVDKEEEERITRERLERSKMVVLAKLLYLAQIDEITRQHEKAHQKKETLKLEEPTMKPDFLKMSELRNRLNHLIKYTTEEKLFEKSQICSHIFCNTPFTSDSLPVTVTFSDVLRKKIVKSQFGRFLLRLNAVQSQEQEVREMKLVIAEFEMKYGKQEIFCDGFPDLLRAAVKLNEPITSRMVHSLMTNLRLADCQISKIDKGLKKLNNLQSLSLAGNWLTDISGNDLPRSLKFLELYSNYIHDVTGITTRTPTWLLHLCLARNKLTDDSQLILLSNSMTFLRSLNVEDNDICDLQEVLKVLKRIRFLVSLSLQGNPCATCICYRESVLHYIPRLDYLDNVEVWSLDRECPPLDQTFEKLSWEGSLLVTCYRLMGLPQPPNEKLNKKKVIKTFHLEIELPLLDPALRLEELPEEDVEEEEVKKEEVPSSPNKKGKKGERGKKGDSKNGKGKKEKSAKKEKKEKSKVSKNKSGKSSKKTNSSRASSPTRNPLDLLNGVEVDKIPGGYKTSWFLTSRQPWSKMIQFPSLEIPAPDNDLTLLRDTLRSKVRVRVILLKTLPPGKPKKPKKPKKGKPEPPPPPPPVETIISKTIIAEFKMELKSVAWCDKSQDYNWAMDNEWKRPKTAEASIVGENLWNLLYDDPKGKKGKKGKKEKKAKGKKGKNGGGADAKPTTLPLPNTPTFHIGVGLKRIQVPIYEIKQDVPKSVPRDVPVVPSVHEGTAAPVQSS